MKAVLKKEKKQVYHLADNLNEVLANRLKRMTYTFRYDNRGNGHYIRGDEILSVEEMKHKYPVEILKPLPKGGNPDGTKKWLNGEKSY